MLDIRLNNTSQLAGFAKRDDLRYFLMAIGGIEYAHLPELVLLHLFHDPGDGLHSLVDVGLRDGMMGDSP